MSKPNAIPKDNFLLFYWRVLTAKNWNEVNDIKSIKVTINEKCKLFTLYILLYLKLIKEIKTVIFFKDKPD